jgi:hypothetical protein
MRHTGATLDLFPIRWKIPGGLAHWSDWKTLSEQKALEEPTQVTRPNAAERVGPQLSGAASEALRF